MKGENKAVPDEVWILGTPQGAYLGDTLDEPPAPVRVFIFQNPVAAAMYRQGCLGCLTREERESLQPEGPFPFGPTVEGRATLARRIDDMKVLVKVLVATGERGKWFRPGRTYATAPS